MIEHYINIQSSGPSIGSYDYVSDGTVAPYSYLGRATTGSDTSSLSWAITRIDINTLVSTTPSIGIAIWDDRFTYTYV